MKEEETVKLERDYDFRPASTTEEIRTLIRRSVASRRARARSTASSINDDQGALVCSTTEALLELEEASRMAALDNHELRGASRKLIVRALRMLDAARNRLHSQPKVHE